MRIITVCLGNICRSPAAEAVLRPALAREGLTHDVTDNSAGDRPDRGVEVASAGTADYHVGERPHQLTIEVGEQLGYEFTTRGAQLTSEDLATADLLLVMDESNRANALALAADDAQRAKVRLLGEFASDADTAGVREVPDPWGHPREQFEAMYRQIEDAVPGVVAFVRQTLRSRGA